MVLNPAEICLDMNFTQEYIHSGLLQDLAVYIVRAEVSYPI